MKRILKSWKHPYLARVGIFLIAIVLIVGAVSCGGATYSLTMVANPVVGGNATDLTNASPYAAGTLVNIKAVANTTGGYHFANWTVPAGTFGNATAATTTFTMPAQNVTVTANFVKWGLLDHFTYYLKSASTYIGDNVTPEDHFGAVNATVEWDVSFCNPAEKLYYEPISWGFTMSGNAGGLVTLEVGVGVGIVPAPIH